MTLHETIVEFGGVFRCCLASIGHEFKPDKKVVFGDKSQCEVCHEIFTLVPAETVRHTAYRDLTKPIWKPDWQLEKGEKC
jgi:hypothetical protein